MTSRDSGVQILYILFVYVCVCVGVVCVGVVCVGVSACMSVLTSYSSSAL